MAISRAQLSEQIDALSNGGTSTAAAPQADPTIADQYVSGLKSIDRSPAEYKDVLTRAQELAAYFPAPRRMSLFDLASSVARGLAQNAQSGRPTPLGYGLGVGFDLFTQESQRRRDEADKMKQQLLLMARQEIEKERADDIKLAEAGLEASFKLQLEKLKQAGSGVFQGKGDLASALNFILRAEQDPELKKTAEYKIALAVAGRPRTQVIQTEEGASTIVVPGLDINKALGTTTDATTTPPPEAPEGFTFTGMYVDGKPVYRNDETGQEGFLQ
tara:strand:+ start:262 stop:1080 length:819 start_codon:yes stop_codon:yes gene_type:complete